MKKKTMTLEQHHLFREVKRLMTNSEPDKRELKTERRKNVGQPALLARQVSDFLKSNYDFRYNLLTEENEYRSAGESNTPFLPVGSGN